MATPEKHTITLLYFAQLKEELGIEKEEIEVSFNHAAALKELLCGRGKKWQEMIEHPHTHIAINHELSSWQAKLPKNAEVALFPPITGG